MQLNLAKDKSYRDLNFLCGGQTLSYHQAILVPMSPILEAMVQGDLCHPSVPVSPVSITLDQVSPDALRVVMELVYTGQSKAAFSDIQRSDIQSLISMLGLEIEFQEEKIGADKFEKLIKVTLEELGIKKSSNEEIKEFQFKTSDLKELAHKLEFLASGFSAKSQEEKSAKITSKAPKSAPTEIYSSSHDIWAYYTPLPNERANCLTCLRDISRSFTGKKDFMVSHMSHFHPDIYSQYILKKSRPDAYSQSTENLSNSLNNYEVESPEQSTDSQQNISSPAQSCSQINKLAESKKPLRDDMLVFGVPNQDSTLKRNHAMVVNESLNFLNEKRAKEFKIKNLTSTTSAPKKKKSLNSKLVAEEGQDPGSGTICPLCFKEFPKNGPMRRHFEDIHQPGKFPCAGCQKVFSSRNKMSSHYSRNCKRKTL